MNSPVAFFIYRRPDLTARVFERIAQVKPSRLLVIADGPASADEAALVEQSREIATRVHWPCKVEVNFSDANMGCRNRVASGLDWVFEQCESAIIIEDDILPDPSFFIFCDAMLERFRDENQIMQICGMNTLGKWKAESQSYHFSLLEGMWGWASWRRAWKFYDVNISAWADEESRRKVQRIVSNDRDFKQVCDAFDATFQGKIDTWDYQWAFARFLEAGLSVVPSLNLISNLGLRADATHTKNPDWRAGLVAHSLLPPYSGAEAVEVDREFEEAMRRYLQRVTSAPRFSKARRILRPARRFLRKLSGQTQQAQ